MVGLQLLLFRYLCNLFCLKSTVMSVQQQWVALRLKQVGDNSTECSKLCIVWVKAFNPLKILQRYLRAFSSVRLILFQKHDFLCKLTK